MKFLIKCKRCGAPYAGEIAPRLVVRCGECRKKMTLPAEGPLAEMMFESVVATTPHSQEAIDVLAEAFASSRLNGGRSRKLRKILQAADSSQEHCEDVLSRASALVSAGSRKAGLKMMLAGGVILLICAGITLVQYLIGGVGGTIYISAGGIGLGGVWALVGLFKWLTGSSIQ